MRREFQKGFTSFRIAMVALCTLAIVLPPQFAAAGAATGLGAGSVSVGTPLVTEVKNKGGKNWYVKRWNRKPYYGNVIAGVALGTLIGVTAAGMAPVAPAPNLCWYWTNPSRNQGYWDYCY